MVFLRFFVSGAFSMAWGVVKAIDYDVLADVVLGQRDSRTGKSSFERDYPDAKQILMDVMEDPSNAPPFSRDSTAETPRLFRSMGQIESDTIGLGDRHPKRYFSPQKITAQQYSNLWRHNTKPRRVGEFEMPVPLDHESVLSFHPGEYRGWSKYPATEDWISDEEKERLAEGSGISVEDALDRLALAEGAYYSSPGHVDKDKRRIFNEMLQNAGYDYIRHNELASQELKPPIFTRIGWRTPIDRHDVHPDVSNLAREIKSKFGYKYPYKSVWHTGNEESAPVFLGAGERTGSQTRTRTDDLLDLVFSGRIDNIYGGIFGYGDDS